MILKVKSMFEGKKVFILGMGRSGVSVAKLLSKKNTVLITDIKNDNLEEIKELENLGVNVVITDKQVDIFESDFDVVVKNPGVKLDHPIVLKAKKYNIGVVLHNTSCKLCEVLSVKPVIRFHVKSNAYAGHTFVFF